MVADTQPLTAASGHQSKTSSASSSDIALYDPACMITMNRELARGYVTLLSGRGPGDDERPTKKSKKDKNNKKEPASSSSPAVPVGMDAHTLGFVALTDGNVIEACFGMRQRDTKNRSYKQVEKIKELLREASDTSDAIPSLSVEAYCNAFSIVVALQDEASKLNFCTRCLFYPGIMKKALADLKTNFAPLQEALQHSTL